MSNTKNKWDDSQQLGNNAESRFVQWANKHSHRYEKSTKNQDMVEHWDYLLCGHNVINYPNGVRVEVKSRKKARRGDAEFADDWIYVEFLNVKGEAGWLYGKADYIAFERTEGFLFVKRTDLVALAKKLVRYEIVSRPTPYKSYRRWGRPYELVSVLLIGDVLSLEHTIET